MLEKGEVKKWGLVEKITAMDKQRGCEINLCARGLPDLKG